MNEDNVLEQNRHEQQQMEALRRATLMTEPVMMRQNVLGERELETYSQLRQQQGGLEENDRKELEQLQDKLVKHLLVLEDGDLEGLQALPQELLEERQRRLDEVNKAANLSGMEKVKNDFFGTKKRAAQRRIDNIKQLHATVDAINRQQEQLQDSELHEEAKQTISRGRCWANPLRAAMNHFSLGSHEDRHKEVEFPQVMQEIKLKVAKNAAEGDEESEPAYDTVTALISMAPQPVEIKTGEGTLRGCLYSPNSPTMEQDHKTRLITSLERIPSYQLANDQKEAKYRTKLNALIERRNALTEEDPQLNASIRECEQNISRTETQRVSLAQRKVKEQKEIAALEERLSSMKEQQQSGKLVIFFSGSGGPAASMVKGVAKTYISAGASVLSVDYRGFGQSVSEKVGTDRSGQETRKTTGTHLCEGSIYQDGQEIYNYAVNELGYKPGDIILHGFSLGGAVASKLAADIAQKNAASDQPVPEEQKLGGVVLHSAIDSMYGASSRMVGLDLAGTLGWMGSGGYNTASHMRRLHKFDPAVPVHYRGGHAEDDQLSMDTTSLHRDPLAAFANTSTYFGNEGHQNGDEAANMDDGTASMFELVKKGRAADLRATGALAEQ